MNTVTSSPSAARKFAAFIALAAGIVAADQVTKQLALSALGFGGAVDLLAFLRFQLAFNRGAAFGFLAAAGGWQTVFLSALATVLSVVLTVWLWRAARRGQRLLCWALALIVGGAVGNLVDRVVYQFVIDFVVLHHRGWQFPAFNIADISISVGAALLILDHLFGRDDGGGDGDGDGGRGDGDGGKNRRV